MPLPTSLRRSLVRVLFAAAATASVASVAPATWSIVVVNTRTREVAVASATCLTNFNLRPRQAVVRVGVGAGASQATIDDNGVNRLYMWNQMPNGLAPAQMIQDLATLDPGHQNRQLGIAVLYDAPASFTGANTLDANPQVFGEAGELRYAIQGNILAGDAVVANAEAALIATPGDLSLKVMAAMEAARATGGDGRCSCNQPDPTACGAPPASFTYSAFTAYITVARLGDVDGTCTIAQGCANGQYFCNLTAISGVGGFEPVLRLQSLYTGWRAGLATRADQVETRVVPFARRLPADGVTSTTVEVEVRNIEGAVLEDVRTALRLTQVAGTAANAVAGEPVVVRPGVFRFPVTAGTQAGSARWRLEALHEGITVRLTELELAIEPAAELFAGFATVRASADTVVPFTLDLGAARAGASYLLLGTASGTVPGVALEGALVPLNSDFVFRSSYRFANTGRFQNTSATLDAFGRAEARFASTAHLLDLFVGRRFDWCAIVRDVPGAAPHVTNVASFDLGP
ncbi:MAG: DUF1028 domain-containing protein [Planctomycetes bacterium]|nr:DUF1028 domain-containing protein [Planctomycetota bacterium]